MNRITKGNALLGRLSSKSLRSVTIPLNLSDARLAAYAAIAAAGGLLATDTAPALARRNSGTDPVGRISWAAAGVVAIGWDFWLPEEADDTEDAELHIIASMAGATDTPIITAQVFFGIGGTNAGSAFAAVTGTTPTDQDIDVNIPAGVAGSAGRVILTPAAHGTDILRLDGAYFIFKRK